MRRYVVCHCKRTISFQSNTLRVTFVTPTDMLTYNRLISYKNKNTHAKKKTKQKKKPKKLWNT